MFEVRIHSRGGEGGVTAARLFALAAFRDGKYATACPFYGPERRGAPVVSFVRIDNHPIRVYSPIRSPDMVVVLDASVMETVDVLSGIRPAGMVVVNSSRPVKFEGHPTCTVDLTGIAMRFGLLVAGGPVLDAPVLGVLARLAIISMNSAELAISEMFPDPRDLQAARAAYQEAVTCESASQ